MLLIISDPLKKQKEMKKYLETKKMKTQHSKICGIQQKQL